MRALDHLARFLRTREDDHEVRAYLETHAVDLAEAFGTTEVAFRAGVAGVEDDGQLVRRVMAEVKTANKSRRDLRVQQRASAAQVSADVLSTAAVWDADRAHVDVVSLLSACLTRPDDLLVFVTEDFTVSVPQARLFALARLERVDLAGFIDSRGLHIRWSTGGLTFYSRPPEGTWASRVFFNMPPRSAALAA